MIRDIILHIGAPKTGSTAIQERLRACSAVLSKRGVFVPESAGVISHAGLSLYAADPWPVDSLRRAYGLRHWADFRAWRTTFAAQFAAELRGSGAERVILSSEFLYQRLTSRREIARLKRLLHPLARHVRVVVYLRRQDRMALALHASASRHGALRPFAFPGPLRAGLFDFYARLRGWASVFGQGAMTVRPFERGALRDGDVLADFAEIAEAPELAETDGARAVNPTPPAAVLEFMRRMNRVLPRFVEDRPNPVRGDLGDIVEELGLAGPPLAAPEAAARRFYDRFVSGNADVARRWLGREDGVLFKDLTFDDPDPMAIGEPLDLDAAIRISAALWAYQERRRREVLETAGMRDGG